MTWLSDLCHFLLLDVEYQELNKGFLWVSCAYAGSTTRAALYMRTSAYMFWLSMLVASHKEL